MTILSGLALASGSNPGHARPCLASRYQVHASCCHTRPRRGFPALPFVTQPVLSGPTISLAKPFDGYAHRAAPHGIRRCVARHARPRQPLPSHAGPRHASHASRHSRLAVLQHALRRRASTIRGSPALPKEATGNQTIPPTPHLTGLDWNSPAVPRLASIHQHFQTIRNQSMPILSIPAGPSCACGFAPCRAGPRQYNPGLASPCEPCHAEPCPALRWLTEPAMPQPTRRRAAFASSVMPAGPGHIWP